MGIDRDYETMVDKQLADVAAPAAAAAAVAKVTAARSGFAGELLHGMPL